MRRFESISSQKNSKSLTQREMEAIHPNPEKHHAALEGQSMVQMMRLNKISENSIQLLQLRKLNDLAQGSNRGNQKPTLQMKGVAIHDDTTLKRESLHHGPPVVQGVFTYKSKEYYAGDVKPDTAIYKDLKNHEHFEAYLPFMEKLAALDDEIQIPSKGKMIEILDQRYGDEIKEAIAKGQADAAQLDETEEKLKSGKGVKKVRGFGHVFSNGKHGPDMAKNKGAKAVARAKDEDKEAIGVWISEPAATKLITAAYTRVGGVANSYFVKVPLDGVGIEYLQDGSIRDAEGFFMLINEEGIVVTAYPAQASSVAANEVIEFE
jgi:hypothetical protein